MIYSEEATYYTGAICLLIGVGIGVMIGHYTTKEEERKKWKKRKPVTFCPHCGEKMKPLAHQDSAED